jgi:hypothetical protein
MTDVKGPAFIESLLHVEELGRSLLYDVYGNEVCSIPDILNHIDTLTRERDAAVQDATHQLELRYAANRELVALQRETDVLRVLEQDVADTLMMFNVDFDTETMGGHWQGNQVRGMGRKLKKTIIALRAANQDADRLDWMADIIAIEAFGIGDVDAFGGCVGMDIYEHASQVADERGNDDDPTVGDQREGFRRMIDAARTVDAERRA